MKRVWKALAILAFLAIGAYGLTQFLEAQTTRQVLADAEAFCAERGGVGTIAAEGGSIDAVSCNNGETFVP